MARAYFLLLGLNIVVLTVLVGINRNLLQPEMLDVKHTVYAYKKLSMLYFALNLLLNAFLLWLANRMAFRMSLSGWYRNIIIFIPYFLFLLFFSIRWVYLKPLFYAVIGINNHERIIIEAIGVIVVVVAVTMILYFVNNVVIFLKNKYRMEQA